MTSKTKPLIIKKEVEPAQETVKVKVQESAPAAPVQPTTASNPSKLTRTRKQTKPILTGSFPALPEDKTKLVISFDVGIINLAYCLLSLEPSGPVIYDWNIINMAGGDPKKTCSTLLKNQTGKSCTTKAFYTDATGKGVCLTHAKTRLAVGEVLNRNLTVANVTEAELKEKLFRSLDANPIFLEASMVLVEQQPLKGMEKIRGVGHALFDYFVLQG
jgi:hypothetical protein